MYHITIIDVVSGAVCFYCRMAMSGAGELVCQCIRLPDG